MSKRGAHESPNEATGGEAERASNTSKRRLMRKSYGRHLKRQRRRRRRAGLDASKLQSPSLSVVLRRNRKTAKREKAPAWRPTRLRHSTVPLVWLRAERLGTVALKLTARKSRKLVTYDVPYQSRHAEVLLQSDVLSPLTNNTSQVTRSMMSFLPEQSSNSGRFWKQPGVSGRPGDSAPVSPQ